MNYAKKTCSFTGYRWPKLNSALEKSGRTFNEFRTVLTNEIHSLINDGFEIFQCGMAIGCDMIFAEIILEYKNRYPTIEFNAFIPCLNQDKSWKEFDKERYGRILKQADEVRLINNCSYFDGCMQKRNIALVDSCNALLAVYHGTSGGTKQTVEYAKKNGVMTIIIDPETFLKITLHG